MGMEGGVARRGEVERKEGIPGREGSAGRGTEEERVKFRRKAVVAEGVGSGCGVKCVVDIGEEMW